MSLSQVIKELLPGKQPSEIEKIGNWCIKREKPDKLNAIPKGKIVNVYVVIEPLSRLIIRQEQETTDVTVVPSRSGHSLPAILNPKFQSGAVRRQMLTLLHEWFDRAKKEHMDYIDELKKKYGYSKDNYTCVMRPYLRRGRSEGGKAEEVFEGYCGECPNCLIFGYAVMEGAGYNVKSRVEGDLYVSPVPYEKAVVRVTFNAVDDIAKTTYRPESEESRRTGALYEFSMIEVGIPFVGKLVFRDMTLAELLLTLVTLARTTRVGGRTTHFGEIRIHIPAILFSKYEIGGGYEIANRILSKNGTKVPTIEETINEVAEYVKQFEKQGILVLDRELGDRLRTLSQENVDQIVLQAWKDVLVLKKSLDEFTGTKL